MRYNLILLVLVLGSLLKINASTPAQEQMSKEALADIIEKSSKEYYSHFKNFQVEEK